MPYKDPERKKEWERLHRPQRLARRRELRRIEGAQQEPRREIPRADVGISALLVPVIAVGAVAACDPMLGMGTGGVTLAIAAIYKKRWTWWIVGVVILAVALFFYWNHKNAAESRSGGVN
jgi:hypothetical protein